MPEATLTAPAAAPVAPSATPNPATPTIDLKSSPFSALETKARTAPLKAVPKEEGAQPAEDLSKPAEAKVEAKPAPSKEDRTAKDPKWFREQHEKAQNEIRSYQERVKAHEAKIAEYESRGKDTTALVERQAALEKELDAARGELRAAKQEVSPEFKEKWEKPFAQSAKYTQSIIEQMAVTDEAGSTRQATWDDFISLYQQPIAKASALARSMFGDDAALVIGQLNELHRLDYQKGIALEEEKGRWKEHETKEQAQRVQHEQGFKAMVQIAQKDLAELTPEFQDKPGDDGKESRELREQGYALFDDRPKSIQEAAIKAAQVRHMVAAHYPLVRQISSLREELKDALAENAELKGNGPSKGRRSTPAAGGTSEGSWQEELRKNVPAGSGG